MFINSNLYKELIKNNPIILHGTNDSLKTIWIKSIAELINCKEHYVEYTKINNLNLNIFKNEENNTILVIKNVPNNNIPKIINPNIKYVCLMDQDPEQKINKIKTTLKIPCTKKENNYLKYLIQELLKKKSIKLTKNSITFVTKRTFYNIEDFYSNLTKIEILNFSKKTNFFEIKKALNNNPKYINIDMFFLLKSKNANLKQINKIIYSIDPMALLHSLIMKTNELLENYNVTKYSKILNHWPTEELIIILIKLLKIETMYKNNKNTITTLPSTIILTFLKHKTILDD